MWEGGQNDGRPDINAQEMVKVQWQRENSAMQLINTNK